jgi:hypothetical protein
MAVEKPLDPDVVQAWLDAWDESDPFSDPAVLHLQSLIADSHCLLAVTLTVAGEPRSLVFRRQRYVLPAVLGQGAPILIPNASKNVAAERGTAGTGRRPPAQHAPTPPDHHRALRLGWHIGRGRKIPVISGAAAPAAPRVGQLWHQTGVKLERVLRWDGADWVIAGHVIDSPSIMMQGEQACDFMEALALARRFSTLLDCEFIYTFDGSVWGHA